MRPMSCVLCMFFALLTVLSFVPVIMLLWTCVFSLQCVAHNFGQAMAFPGLHRKLTIVMALGPFMTTISYILIFLRCHKTHPLDDALHQRFRVLD